MAGADVQLLLEEQVAKEALGDLPARLEKFNSDLIKRWIRAFGSMRAKGEDLPAEKLDKFIAAARSDLRSLLKGVPGSADAAIRAGIEKAYRLGLEQALEELPTGAGSPDLSGAVRAATGALGLSERLGKMTAEAEKTLNKTAIREIGLPGALAAGGKARKVANAIKAEATYQVNAGASEAVRQTAEANGVGLIWIAERDACLHCLAYAGEVSAPGGGFPTGKTFADKPLPPGPSAIPPKELAKAPKPQPEAKGQPKKRPQTKPVEKPKQPEVAPRRDRQYALPARISLDDWSTAEWDKIAATRESDSEGDPGLGMMYKIQGYDRKPEKGSLDKIARGWVRIYRGLHGDKAEQYVEDFSDEDYFPGLGIFANGTYTTTNKEAALNDYAGMRESNLIRMALRPDARVIDINDIVDMLDKWGEEYPDKESSIYRALWDDPGRFATALGYDAILKKRGNGAYYILLNRTAVVVEG